VARVWDALFNEGPKVLFRVALALLKVHEALLLRCDNAGEASAAGGRPARPCTGCAVAVLSSACISVRLYRGWPCGGTGRRGVSNQQGFEMSNTDMPPSTPICAVLCLERASELPKSLGLHHVA